MAKNQWPLQRDCGTFYGNPASAGFGANLVFVDVPWPMWYEKTPVSHIQIHKKCAASLTRVLAAIWADVGQDVAKIKLLRYDQFSGSYNLRPKRGGTSWSMHAYGAAIDFDYADNQFHAVHHLFTEQSPLVVEFEKEGWIWGGRWSPGSVDAMHVQAARIHP